MEFYSILSSKQREKVKVELIKVPKYFTDLNLDQIVQDIMDEKKMYDLRPYYYEIVGEEDILYRQAVLRDMERSDIYHTIENFVIELRKVKEYLIHSAVTDIDIQQQKWRLDAAFHYVQEAKKFVGELENLNIQSQGFQDLLHWLNSYLASEEFQKIKNDAEELMSEFQKMKYHIQLKRDRIIVVPEYLEMDYCKELLDIFQESIESDHVYQNNPFGTMQLSDLEGAILEMLMKQCPEPFTSLKVFSENHPSLIHEKIDDFEQEIQFYFAFLSYKKNMEMKGFHFTYPRISNEKGMELYNGYDLALAKKNGSMNQPVIYNDGILHPKEHFYVITGPNQGGKTTYARALGQIIYFSSIGLMVPCEQARVSLYQDIYTHFAKEESMNTGAGKLKEELVRLKEMMEHGKTNCFVIINEIFTSATSYDAFIMGKKVLQFFMDLDCAGAYVTHIYELTKEDDRIVSLVASLLEDDQNTRTFKIERKASDGRSYANTIVDKYRMTYSEIKERIKR